MGDGRERDKHPWYCQCDACELVRLRDKYDTARAEVERLEADVAMRMANMDSLTRHWDQLERKWTRKVKRLREENECLRLKVRLAEWPNHE